MGHFNNHTSDRDRILTLHSKGEGCTKSISRQLINDFGVHSIGSIAFMALGNKGYNEVRRCELLSDLYDYFR